MSGAGRTALAIAVLLPDVLGTYSDAGNALVLAERARRRDVAAQMHTDAPAATGAMRLYSAMVNHNAAAPSTPPAPTGTARESSQLYAVA